MDILHEFREAFCSLRYQDHTSDRHFCSLIDEFPVWYSEPDQPTMMILPKSFYFQQRWHKIPQNHWDHSKKVNLYQHFVIHPHTYTSWKCLCNTYSHLLPSKTPLCKCDVFIYKLNINYCPQSAYVILVVIVVVVIMVVFVFVSVFNNKTNVSKYAYVILEQLLML